MVELYCGVTIGLSDTTLQGRHAGGCDRAAAACRWRECYWLAAGRVLEGSSEKNVRLARTMQVGPCIPLGIQLETAGVGPTSGSTWCLSHLEAQVVRLASLELLEIAIFLYSVLLYGSILGTDFLGLEPCAGAAPGAEGRCKRCVSRRAAASRRSGRRARCWPWATSSSCRSVSFVSSVFIKLL
jgi:hypothetical protein